MLKQIQEALRQADFDAILITSPQNRRYVTGFPSSAGVCVVTEKSGYLFTDFRYIEAAKKRVRAGIQVDMVRRLLLNENRIRKIAEEAFPVICDRLSAKGVEIRGDKAARQIDERIAWA